MRPKTIMKTGYGFRFKNPKSDTMNKREKRDEHTEATTNYH